MKMKKPKLLLLLIILSVSAIAQTGIDAMINAEKSFAAFAKAHSTKEAFLQYTDSNSLMFDNGKPVKAQDYWKVREKNSGVLNWHPTFAEISASGDLGYTTGPWTFQLKAGDSVIARGQFATVWYRNNDGEWKFLVDLGVDNTPADTTTNVKIIEQPKYPENIAAIARIFPMVAAENAYSAAIANGKYNTCRAYLSSASILCRNKMAPATTPEQHKKIINATPARIRYKMSGWNISPTPDMGYTFGTATVNGKSEGYFRVWRREKEGWKLALEIVRY